MFAAAFPPSSFIIGCAAVRGIAETATECQFAGGCNYTDYVLGAATAGLAPVSAKQKGCSFSEDTLVTTEEGLVPISEVEEGDYVLAYNEETGEVGYYPVTATWVHEDPVLTYLVIEGEFIATTPTHLFYTTEGWVEAGKLGEDAYVVRAGGAPGQVWESLTFTLPSLMYDLTVAEAHTFFVGEEQWLVHNCGGVYVPRDAQGNPISLPQQRVNGQDIPLPDPAAGGYPHTTMGGRVGSDGTVYRQSATFTGNRTWPSANGQDVPWSRVDWTDHNRPWDHPNPHQRVFTYDERLQGWLSGPNVPFTGSQ